MAASGLSHPAFYNDRVIIAGLERAGVAPEDARRYINCTCTEMTTEGCSGIWVVAEYMNFAKCLERVFNDGRDPMGADEPGPRTGSLDQLKNFEDFVAALKKQLDHTIRGNCMRMNHFARLRMASGSYPVLSSFVNDCIESGKDVDEGGARYKFFYPQLVGLATVTDSLVAVRELVYGKKALSLAEFRDALRDNFRSREPLRQRIINDLPKYGTDDPEADDIAVDLFNHYVAEVEKYRNPYGFSYHAGFLSWVMHGRLGQVTGATPDGRLAGEALSDSFAAAQGRARQGPTGICASVEKFGMTRAIGAVVVNLTFDAGSVAPPKGPEALAALVRSHFSRGGFQVQVTSVRREDLIAARERPEDYADLKVRVGGFSEYFVRLDHGLQDKMIQRLS